MDIAAPIDLLLSPAAPPGAAPSSTSADFQGMLDAVASVDGAQDGLVEPAGPALLSTAVTPPEDEPETSIEEEPDDAGAGVVWISPLLVQDALDQPIIAYDRPEFASDRLSGSERSEPASALEAGSDFELEPETPRAPQPPKRLEPSTPLDAELVFEPELVDFSVESEIQTPEATAEMGEAPAEVDEDLELRFHPTTPNKLQVRVEDGGESIDVDIEQVDDGLQVRVVTAPESVNEFMSMEPELERAFEERGLRLDAYSARARTEDDARHSQTEDGQRAEAEGDESSNEEEGSPTENVRNRLLDVRA
ncbi:MAG: hypothetical protein AAFV53_36805 [Myxococcota bacterium]